MLTAIHMLVTKMVSSFGYSARGTKTLYVAEIYSVKNFFVVFIKNISHNLFKTAQYNF